MSENVFSKETTFTEDFLLEAQELYTPVTDQSTIVVKPLANNVNIEELSAPAGNLTDLTFTYRPTAETFINNGVVLRMKIPLKISRGAVLANAPASITENNYVQHFFNNYADLALRQYGLLNLLDTVTVNLNGEQVSSVRNITQQALSIFPYYSEGSLDEFFSASAPDRFQKYSQYNGSTGGIQTLEAYEDKKKFLLSLPNGENDDSIFRSSYRKGYESRKPSITFTSYDETTRTLTGHTIVETFLPFSIFGLTDTSNSLYGVTDMDINIKLKSNPVSHLFSQKKVGGVGPFSELVLDEYATSTKFATLFLRNYRAPDYISNTIKENGMVKPYRFMYSDTSCMQNITSAVPALDTTQVVLNTVNCETVPKSIYIAAIRKKTGNSADMTTTPSVYARISNVTIRMGQIATLYTRSAGCLYNICKGNGLNYDMEQSLYTCGFPMKFDISTDISAAGEAFVGEYKSSNFEIEMSLTNLDNEAHEFEVFTTLVYDSFIQFYDGKFSVQRSLIKGVNLSTTNFAKALYSDRMRRVQMIGGSWLGDVWGKVKKGAKSAYNFYNDNKDTINSVAKGVMSLLKGSGQLNNISGGAYNVSGGSGINPSNALGAGKGVKNALGGKSVNSIHFK